MYISPLVNKEKGLNPDQNKVYSLSSAHFAMDGQTVEKFNDLKSTNLIFLILGILFILIGAVLLWRFFVLKNKKTSDHKDKNSSSSSFQFGYPV